MILDDNINNNNNNNKMYKNCQREEIVSIIEDRSSLKNATNLR